MAVYEGKRWVRPGLLGRREPFDHTSALTRPSVEVISGFFPRVFPSKEGFDFGFLIWRLIHSRRRSYYLFFNYLFFNYLYCV